MSEELVKLSDYIRATIRLGGVFNSAVTEEQARAAAMAEKRAYLHRVAVEEADEDYADSGSLSEDEERERSDRPR